LKSNKNVSRHLPRITIELCSCKAINEGKNCLSARSVLAKFGNYLLGLCKA